VQHAEGSLLSELKLHMNIVRAYEWHIAAAQLEQRNMRERVSSWPPSSCYLHGDFCEKLPVPISGAETCGMFHGAARKK